MYRQLFIGNLPNYVEADDMVAIFQQVGVPLEHCHVFDVSVSGMRSAKVIVANPAPNMPLAIKELHGHLPGT